MIQAWVSLPWAGPGAYYGGEAAATARRLESLGVSGVVQGDHLFLPGPPADDPTARMAADCLTVLTTIAAHSIELGVASLVANVGLRHPFRFSAASRASLSSTAATRVRGPRGGLVEARVRSGRPDNAADRERLARLAETAELARTLFERGWVREGGARVPAVDLPLAPAPLTPPRLLLGGGSSALLELAGRLADHVDLAPPSHRKGENEFQRPLVTTIDDLAESARSARAAGRALTASLLLTAVVICDESDTRDEEEKLCARVDSRGVPSIEAHTCSSESPRASQSRCASVRSG